jgi:hypothetical protein
MMTGFFRIFLGSEGKRRPLLKKKKEKFKSSGKKAAENVESDSNTASLAWL